MRGVEGFGEVGDPHFGCLVEVEDVWKGDGGGCVDLDCGLGADFFSRYGRGVFGRDQICEGLEDVLEFPIL